MLKVYTGPNWLKHGLQTYQVFIDGLPYNVREAITECPEVENLLCSPEELDDFRAKISRKGTRESRLYEIVEKLSGKTRKVVIN